MCTDAAPPHAGLAGNPHEFQNEAGATALGSSQVHRTLQRLGRYICNCVLMHDDADDDDDDDDGI